MNGHAIARLMLALRRPGVWLLILAAGCLLVSLALFPDPTRSPAGWRFYGLSLLAYLAALLFLFPPLADGRERSRLGWPFFLAVVLILILAAAARFYRLSDIPFGFWFDEADIGLIARRVLKDPSYRPIYIDVRPRALHYPWLVSLSFRALSDGVFALRAVTAAFGLGAVIMAFVLGNEVGGRRLGLIMALFFALSRWSITFSRLGLATNTTPFLAMIVFWLLLRGRRLDSRQRLDSPKLGSSGRAFGLAGLFLGLGLGLHPTFWLVSVLVLGSLALWTAARWRQTGPGSWLLAPSMLLLGASLAAGPVVQFALRQPDVFFERSRQVSIVKDRTGAELVQVVAANTAKNLLMFNAEGDSNGRHNIPGQPILDPVSGLLFLAGLGLAIGRLGRGPSGHMLSLFGLGLAASILTWEAEAPSAQRAVAAMPAVIYFMALPVEVLWQAAMPAVKGAITWRGLALIAPLALYVGLVNIWGYFEAQTRNTGVWEAHSTTQTLAAQMQAELPEGTGVYYSMFLDSEIVRPFLAPESDVPITLVPPDVVPLPEPGNRPVAVYLDRDQVWIADTLSDIYPHAQRRTVLNPAGQPALIEMAVPATDIRAIQGLRAGFWPGLEIEDDPAVVRVDRQANWRWPTEAPLAPPFVARWEGVLRAPSFDDYEILLESPGLASLWLDGREVLRAAAPGQGSALLTLAQGNHPMRLEANAGQGRLRLAWRTDPGGDFEEIPAEALYQSPPVTSEGLLATFYPGGDWAADPVEQRIDPFVDAYFHLLPSPRPYSARWDGWIEAPRDGRYTFGLQVNGLAQLTIDNQMVVDATGPTELLEGEIDLSAGRHRLALLFLDYLERSRLHLYWTPPGEQPAPVPSEVLSWQ